MLKSFTLYFLIFTVGFLSLIICGCGYKEPKGRFSPEQMKKFSNPDMQSLPAPSGGLVLAVDGEFVSAEQVIAASMPQAAQMARNMSFDQFAQAIQPHISQHLMDRVTNILLYQSAKKTLPEAVFKDDGPLDKAVESEVRKLLASHGNNFAKAQRELEKNGHDWQSFREFQERQILAQMYFANRIERTPTITRLEMLEFYNENKDELFRLEPNVEFLLIHLIKGDQPDTKIAKAQDILGKIREGEDFEQLVHRYSEGIRAASGGLWTSSDPSSLIEPYDAIAKHIDNVKVGEVSDIIHSNGHIFIFKLLENTTDGYMPFSQVQPDIERNIRAHKRNEQIDNLLEQLFEKANIIGLEGFLSYCIQQTYIRARSM